MSRTKLELRENRKKRIRKKIFGTAQRPRLSVYKSLRYIYAQLIDDVTGRTLASANSMKIKQNGANRETAASVGEMLAERAKAANIKQAVFDRNGSLYGSVLKELAEAARKGGIEF